MNRKIIKDNSKSHRMTCYTEEKIGTLLGIQDKNGNWLRCGDTIKRNNYIGIILFNHHTKRYEIYLNYSRWYGSNIFDIESYGKSIDLPLDNGAKMEITLIKQYDNKEEMDND